MATSIVAFIYWFNWFVFWYFIFFNAFYLVLILLSFSRIQSSHRESAAAGLHKVFQSIFYKPVSILVPAFNEEHTLPENLKSILQIEYPEFEVIVINDGSTDGTLPTLTREFHLVREPHDLDLRLPCRRIRQVYVSRRYPNLVVVDKERGGKSDALNAGINVSRHPLFCSVDADSLLERDCLLKVVRPFMRDARTVAGGGIIRVLNGCTVSHGQNVEVGIPASHLARFQIVEYLRAFLFGRVGLDVLNAVLITSGAFSLYRKDVVVECGGYRTSAIGEDMELICRIHHEMRRQRRPYRVTFIPDPICWTEVPERWRTLGRQRNRWHRGLMDALLSNIGMLFNPRYGSVGLLGMPFFCFFEMAGPTIELTGYLVFSLAWWLGIINWPFAVLFLTAATALGIVLSITAIFLEELSFRRYPKVSQLVVLLVYGILENFGYRQLLLLSRVKGTIDYFLGRTHWGDMGRIGRREKKDGKRGMDVRAPLPTREDQPAKRRSAEERSA